VFYTLTFIIKFTHKNETLPKPDICALFSTHHHVPFEPMGGKYLTFRITENGKRGKWEEGRMFPVIVD
jgi:hypothetical protein